MELFLSRLPSPIGDLAIVTDARDVVRAIDFTDHLNRLHRGLSDRYGAVALTETVTPAAIADAFHRYFAGDASALDALDVDAGGSELQRRVWSSLREIAAGTTTTYGALAKRLGFADPRAAIEIGAAVGANPIALVVPCHRVIASNGDLKGFAWGVHRKRWLLEHEHAVPVATRAPETATLPGF